LKQLLVSRNTNIQQQFPHEFTHHNDSLTAHCASQKWTFLSVVTTTTAATIFSHYTRQRQLKTGGFSWSKVVLPACPCLWS